MQWSQDFCEYLDKWTHYRTRQEVDSAYEKYFCNIEHIEDFWLHLRVEEHKKIANFFPVSAQKLAVTKLCGLVFVARKPVVI